jgi:type 1 glutamine amidotransferase
MLLAALLTSAALPKLLVFSKTTGFRHDSIPACVEAIRTLGQANKFDIDATEDSSVFTKDNLKQYRGIIFAMTTGDILNPDQKAAMQEFVERGGGWVGIHSASDTEYSWPWYAELVGAYFKSHPPGGQTVKLTVEDPKHPSMKGIPLEWSRADEWYDWKANPRTKVHVLISADESTYKKSPPEDHPITWCNPAKKGRSWYTEMGHFKTAYSEPLYLQHLLGGIKWACKLR